MVRLLSPPEFDAAIARLGSGTPGGDAYQELTTLVLDHPGAKRLAGGLDPFGTEYRDAVLELYAALRSRPGDASYLPERDEVPEGGGMLPANLWTGLVPWSFGHTALTGEFLLAWGKILRLLSLTPGQSVLEYGPGSGQMLLMLARMGVRACGVDVDRAALDGISAQAAVLGVPVELERGLFGDGFGEERFDAVLFFEAFHHALDFPGLLARLRDRLKPGGRLVLCGEPVVEAPTPGIPYPWGPRLDALSVMCMRRWGWMELGFVRGFLTEAAERAGWLVTHHPHPDCGRACAFVLVPEGGFGEAQPVSPADAVPYASAEQRLQEEVAALRARVGAVEGSTSWRVTAPLRAVGRLGGRLATMLGTRGRPGP